MGRRSRIREMKMDPYYLKAKKEGYVSRAVYKIMEIDRQFGLINNGDKVLDLGSSPGGWLQYISSRIGIDGVAVGIDIKPVKIPDMLNVDVYLGDIYDDNLIKEIRNKYGKFDVITNDISVNISGVWDVDVARNIDINRRVLEITDMLLKPGGKLVSKMFEGRGTDKIIKEFKRKFKYIKVYKPKASRKRSSETYIICIYYKPFKIYKKSL